MKTYQIVLVVLALMLVIPVVAFAQSTTTLDITTTNITPNLFLGANIMIAALLGVFMLVAGLSFGMNILNKIVQAITAKL